MAGNQHVVLSDKCYLDLDHGDVIKNGLRISLSKREALLMGSLGQQLGHPVPTTKLINDVWGPGGVPFRNSLYKCVHRVRSVLEDDARHPVYLLPLKDMVTCYALEIPDHGNRIPDIFGLT